jgi:hypothetical protein
VEDNALFSPGAPEVPPALHPGDMQPLLGIHPDGKTVDPNAVRYQPPQSAEPEPGSTFDGWKRYHERLIAHAQLVEQRIRGITAERAKGARGLEESLIVMNSVPHTIPGGLSAENPEVADMERMLHAERARGRAGDGKLVDPIEKKFQRARVRIVNAATHVNDAQGVVKQALDGLDRLLRPRQGKSGESLTGA